MFVSLCFCRSVFVCLQNGSLQLEALLWYMRVPVYVRKGWVVWKQCTCPPLGFPYVDYFGQQWLKAALINIFKLTKGAKLICFMLRKSELLPESAVPQSSAECFHVFQTNCVPFSRFWFALVAIKLQVQSGGKMKGLFLCKLLWVFFVSVAFLLLLLKKRHCIAFQPKVKLHSFTWKTSHICSLKNFGLPHVAL